MTEARWSSRAVKQFREEADSQLQVDALLLQESTARQELGPLLWNEIREQVQIKCDRFNTELGSPVAMFKAAPSSELQVQFTFPHKGHRDLSASFGHTSTSGALSWSISGHNINETHGGEYELGVEQGKAVFRTGNLTVESPEKIAETMLSALLLE
jgi:hypothetical protein